MGITRIRRSTALRLIAGDGVSLITPEILMSLLSRKISEYLLTTGAKLIVVQGPTRRSFAVSGYSSNGSDRDITALTTPTRAN